MSNIEKIRQEIERLKKCSKSSKKEWIDEGYNQNAFAEDCRIKSFDKLLAFIDSLPEEDPSEDLEEAAQEYAIPFNNTTYGCEYSYKGFIAGAKWQAKQLLKGSPLPEDTVLFQKGVEEGRRLEKDDLVLTWEDMAKIDAIILDANNEFAVDYSKEIDRRKFYEEVLKRFKEAKK
jgi:hypothetical protein